MESNYRQVPLNQDAKDVSYRVLNPGEKEDEVETGEIFKSSVDRNIEISLIGKKKYTYCDYILYMIW